MFEHALLAIAGRPNGFLAARKVLQDVDVTEISLARIAGTSVALALHVGALLLLVLPETGRAPPPLPTADPAAALVVEFVPAQRTQPFLTPPAPPPQKQAPHPHHARTASGGSPAAVADHRIPAAWRQLGMLAKESDATGIEIATPDVPATEILSYRTAYQPAFPPEAQAAGDHGWVTVRVLVDADGVPLHFVLVKSTATDRLVLAAIAAIKQWRFNPALKDGVAVAAWVDVPIGFYNSRAG